MINTFVPIVPVYAGVISMTSHYSAKTYSEAVAIRVAQQPGSLMENSIVTFDMDEFKKNCWLFDYYEARDENAPSIEKMLGLLDRLTCAANMIMPFELSKDEKIIFQNSGILNKEFLGYPKTTTFTLRITDNVEELIFYNGVYFDREHDFVVHIPGTGIELR
jgi:hypothetical protein